MVIAVGMLHYFCKYLHRQGHTPLLFMPILTFTSVSLCHSSPTLHRAREVAWCGAMTMAVRRDAAVTPRNEGGEGLGPCHSGDLLQPPSPRPATPSEESLQLQLWTRMSVLWHAGEMCSVCVWTAADIFQISDVWSMCSGGDDSLYGVMDWLQENIENILWAESCSRATTSIRSARGRLYSPVRSAAV